MRFYHLLSRLPFLKRYSYKFLFVSFLGIHVPLIGLILFIVLGPAGQLSPGTVIGITLLLTLIATGVTLVILHQLTAPISLLKEALRAYLLDRQLPALPTDYKDEAGILMHDVQLTLSEFNYLLEEKKDLLDLLSHDLRSPIINIQQAVDIVRKETEPEVIERFYQTIEKSAEQQLNLIKTITGFWEHESSKTQLYEISPLSLSAVVNEVLQQQATLLHQKQLTIHNHVPSAHQVMGNKKLLAEALSNLIFNAIKFSRPGNAIQISSELADARTRVAVQDAGIGFDPEKAEVLFQRFTPLRRKGTAGEDTIGLGLYLSRRMLQKQGGSITAYSAGEGHGAVFTIDLKTAGAVL